MKTKLNQKYVDDWNAKYPEETPVEVTRDNGEVLKTVTKSGAQMLGGHTAVIWVKGISGCYDLRRVRPVVGVVE